MLRRKSFGGDDALNSTTLAGPGRVAPRRGGAHPGLQGKVNVNPRGFAFVTCDDGKAFYARQDLARRLLTNDVVRFRPNPAATEGSYDVLEIQHVTRQEQVMLCAASRLAGLTYLVPDEPCFQPIQLTDELAEGSFAAGDVLAVRIPAFDGAPRDMTEPGGPLRAVFISNLGARNRPGFDLDYARMRWGFEQSMPAELDAAVAAIELPSASGVLYAEPFVTIDGESTRDFDDAVYAAPLAHGGWRVMVAIADVSLFVQEGTALDNWASSRCTSVYLPGQTLPMLPEGLSTDLCSLVPGVERHAVVLDMELNSAGAVLKRTLGRGRIVSAARLTYTEVAAFLAMAPADDADASAVDQNLRHLNEVYKVLSAKRGEQGRLDFDEPEPTVKQRDGKLVVEWEVRNDAHKLVEELMLLANQQAAGMLVARYGLGLFRHQPKPSVDSWSSLTEWATAQGHELPGQPCLQSMSGLVQAMQEGERRAEAIMKVRMSMSPARYVVHSEQDLERLGGHFSLSAPWYTHFTSPIRRYADLLVHRLLLAPPEFTCSGKDARALEEQVERCSERSQASRMAERLVWDRLKLKGFLEEHSKDDVVSARVVRITGRGFRVVLTGWQVAAWLSGADLRRAGISKRLDDVWTRGEGEGAAIVREGAQLQVSWQDLNLERAAYPELQVKLAA